MPDPAFRTDASARQFICCTSTERFGATHAAPGSAWDWHDFTTPNAAVSFIAYARSIGCEARFHNGKNADGSPAWPARVVTRDAA
jgi:hypothetical protein